MIMMTAKAAPKAPHIVIVGGAYAGLSALNSLVSLSAGKGHPEGKRRGGPPEGRSGRGNARGGLLHGPPRAGGALDSALPRALRTKPRYTILDERDGFYHTVGAPLGQISAHFARDFWVKFDEILPSKVGEDITFIQGKAVEVDMGSKSLTILRSHSPTETERLSYDFLVVASGMSRKWPVVPKSFAYESYVKDVEAWEKDLEQCKRIVLVGGGACGIEMAAELKVHFPTKEILLLHSRDKLLSNEPLSDEFKSIALKLLQEQGVDVRLNTRLKSEKATSSSSSRTLTLSTGDTLQCDKVIYTAAQLGANTEFLPASLKEDKWGCIKVRDTFQFAQNLPNADFHYAVGDVAHWPSIIKRCGPAQSQGKHAAANIIASLVALEDGKSIFDAELQPCLHGQPSMTLAVGEQAIGMRNGLRYGREIKMRAFGSGLGIDGSLASLGIRPRRVNMGGEVSDVGEDGRYRISHM